MRVMHIKNEAQREACLARLCAEVYGHQAGLAPLSVFAGVLGVLIKQEAARVLALVDDDARPIALALLAMDETGQSMNVMQVASLVEADGTDPGMRLIAELASRAPLRVDAINEAQQQRFEAAGITRWLDGKSGVRIGLGPKHPTRDLSDLPRTLTVDEQAVAQSFKRDPKAFEDYKRRFIRGLESFPATL
ncbi:hypothetical protein [Halomonas halmophila]|uniref:Uncharacterized protein n=1 Tax=Halomonas halmophila TaxID=252 RepID=A0A4Y4EVZ3_9GAMM|nr:hypothetical protein [Halomonas halmophila]GED22092.1 hypothetical protein HHA01_10690 [Halomonas halmophila]